MKNLKTNQYFCKIVSQLAREDVIAWRELWEISQHSHFFNAVSFFEAYRETFHVEKYIVVFCYRDGILCAVLPLIEDRIFGIRVFATPSRRENSLDHCTLLVDEYSKELVQTILSSVINLGNIYLAELKSLEMEIVKFQQFPVLIRQVSKVRCRALFSDSNILEHMSLGKKRNLRRRMRHINDRLEFHVEGVKALAIVKKVEKESHRPRCFMALFKNDSAEKFLCSLEKHNPGSICVGVLYLSGHPIATNLGFIYKNTFCDYHMAFVEKYRSLGPGITAAYLMLEQLRKSGFAKIDFLRGDSEFKQQFAKEVNNQYDAYLSKSHSVILWWRIWTWVWNRLKRISAGLRMIPRQVRVMRQNFQLKRNQLAKKLWALFFGKRGLYYKLKQFIVLRKKSRAPMRDRGAINTRS